MPAVLLSEDEQWVLSLCDGIAYKCYVRMRARMDFATCVVGRRSGVSYTMMREWSAKTIPKGRGEIEVKPSMRTVRTALAELQRRGLLRRIDTEHLVFFMPLAAEGLERSNRTRHKPDKRTRQETRHEPDTMEANNGAGFGDYEGPNQTPNPTSPQGQNAPNPTHIRVYVNPKPLGGGVHDSEAVDAAPIDDAALSLARSWSGGVEPARSPQMQAAIDLVVGLRKAGVRCNAQHPKLLAWVAERIEPSLIARAVGVAKARRGESNQPINVGLLDVIVRDLLEWDKREPAEAWWTSEAATLAKAKALGLTSAYLETFPLLRARIRACLDARRADKGKAQA